jgi:hypothetical protein
MGVEINGVAHEVNHVPGKGLLGAPLTSLSTGGGPA